MANKNLSATITIGGTVAASFLSSIGKANAGLGSLGKSISDLTRRQKLLGSSIQQFGRMGKDVDGLRSKYAAVGSEIDRLRQKQDRLNASIKLSEKMQITGLGMVGAGASMNYAGRKILSIAQPGIHASIERENAVNVIRNSGASKEEQDAMIAAAQNHKQFGVSVTEATKIIGELRASLGSASHAIEALPTALKAKSGLQLYNREHPGKEVDDDAAYSLAKIADERGGANNPETMREQMNWAFKAITGSQGKLSASDLLTAQRGAKAAGVAASDESFFGDTFLMQALGAPGYGKALSSLNNAWIGGHQDKAHLTNMLKLGLLDQNKIKTSSAGLVKEYSPDALVDNQLFIKDQQGWVEKHLVPLAKKKGINLDDDAAVQAFAASITSNTNATNVLFQRLKNRTSIDRDRSNVLAGHGIDESDAQNKKSTAGNQADAQARLNDAYARMGKDIMPLYTKSLELAAGALEKLNAFMEKNPKMSSALVVGVVGIGAALTVLGPVIGAAGLALNLYASRQLKLASDEATAAAKTREQTLAIEQQGTAATKTGGKLGALGALLGRLAVANIADSALGNMGVGGEEINEDQDKKNWSRMNWWQHAESGAGRGIEWAGDTIGLSNMSNEARSHRIEAETDYFKKEDAAKLIKAAAVASPTTNTFNIYQQPGQDGKAFAKQVADEIERQKLSSARGALYDGAGAR